MNNNETAIHAHIDTESRDCDGRYSDNFVTGPAAGQTEECFRKTTRELWGSDCDNDTESGFESYEPTEEGYRNVTVEFCEDTTCRIGRGTYRDHTAESMGY